MASKQASIIWLLDELESALHPSFSGTLLSYDIHDRLMPDHATLIGTRMEYLNIAIDIAGNRPETISILTSEGDMVEKSAIP